jgi:hypothetical protein
MFFVLFLQYPYVLVSQQVRILTLKVSNDMFLVFRSMFLDRNKYEYNSEILNMKCHYFLQYVSLFREIAKTISSQLYLYRAWPNKAEDPELLKLTAKILLDSQTNLKSIQLAFNIVQVFVTEPNPAF